MKMGKVKYQKRVHATVRSKTKEKQAISKQPCSKEKEQLKMPSLSQLARHCQRRLAITPADISFHHKFTSFDSKRISPYKPADKGQDNLHLPKQNKRARKRMLAKKKMAGAFGNMGSLADALPAVEEVSKNRSVTEKPRLKKSLKAQEMEMIKDIQWYRGAVQDSSFQADPWQACASYVNFLLMNEQKKSS